MPEVVVRLPGLLARFTDGAGAVRLEAETLEGATEALLARYPALETHLFDQSGALRPHVRLLVNGRVLPTGGRPELPLEPGDEIAFVQAVSGG